MSQGIFIVITVNIVVGGSSSAAGALWSGVEKKRPICDETMEGRQAHGRNECYLYPRNDCHQVRQTVYIHQMGQ